MGLRQSNLKMLIKILFLHLTALCLSNCATAIPDIEVCASGYSLEMGASCVSSLSDKTRELSGAEFMAYLEPSPTKASALCMSSSDYSKLKTVIEQLCHKQGQKCTKAMKKALSRLDQIDYEIEYE